MRVFAALLLVVATSSPAQDYEREKRWAAEVVPNVVVGDAVQLKLPSGREFLGLFAERKDAPAAVPPAPTSFPRARSLRSCQLRSARRQGLTRRKRLP